MTFGFRMTTFHLIDLHARSHFVLAMNHLKDRDGLFECWIYIRGLVLICAACSLIGLCAIEHILHEARLFRLKAL
jgi:hypothetical protein